MKKNKKVKGTEVEAKPIKLDIGCGGNKISLDFIGVDKYKMNGVDIVCDVGSQKLPFEDNSVDEIYSAHFLEHLTNLGDKWERIHFFNEMYRVLKPGEYKDGQPIRGFARLLFPHWCSTRYYGDPTHKEPFSEMGFYYLSRTWRIGGKDAQGNEVVAQAPHADKKWNKHGYDCDFDASWGYNPHQTLLTRNQEYVQNAFSWYKEAIQDINAVIVKK